MHERMHVLSGKPSALECLVLLLGISAMASHRAHVIALSCRRGGNPAPTHVLRWQRHPPWTRQRPCRPPCSLRQRLEEARDTHLDL